MNPDKKHSHIPFYSDSMLESRVHVKLLSDTLKGAIMIAVSDPAIKAILRDVPAADACDRHLQDMKRALTFLEGLPKERIQYIFNAVTLQDLERFTSAEEACHSFLRAVRDMQEHPDLYKKILLREQAPQALEKLAQSLQICCNALVEHNNSIVRYAVAFCPMDLNEFWKMHPEIKRPLKLHGEEKYFGYAETEKMMKIVQAAEKNFPPLPTLHTGIDRIDVPEVYKKLVDMENTYVMLGLMQRFKGTDASIYRESVVAQLDPFMADQLRMPRGDGKENYLPYAIVDAVADRRQMCMRSLSEIFQKFEMKETEIHARIAALDNVAASLASTTKRPSGLHAGSHSK